MVIHEHGDEALRPTDKAWKCPKCRKEFLTISCINSHKERCTNNPDIKPDKPQKSKYDIEREKQLNENLREFKKEHNIR